MKLTSAPKLTYTTGITITVHKHTTGTTITVQKHTTGTTIAVDTLTQAHN